MKRIVLAVLTIALVLLIPAAALASEASVLADHEGISTGQAEADLAIQHKIGGIVTKEETALGGNYAGAYMDNVRGELVVEYSGGTKAAAEGPTNAVGVTANTKFKKVKRSLANLEAKRNTLDQQLAAYEQSQQVTVALYPKANKPRVMLANTLAATTKKAIKDKAVQQEATSATVAASSLQSQAQVCSFPYCLYPNQAVQGGVRIDASGGGWCSAGFVVGNSSGHYLLTAGHCLDHAPFTTAECQLPYANARVDEGADAGALGISCPANYPAYATDVVTWGEERAGNWWDTVQIRAYESPGKPYVGQLECHYGATSVAQCGVVQYTNARTVIYYGWPRGYIGVQHTDGICALSLPGDSGGPWISFVEGANGIAQGINIAGNSTSCGAISFEAGAAIAAMNVVFLSK